MKLKTLLTSVLSSIAIAASACWFTQDNFNGNYIAFLSGDVAHYTKTDLLSNAVYHNGQTVSMPFTVFVKVGDRFQDGEGNSTVKRAVLQYKVLPDGGWVTVKDINNPNWKMNFENPVALFGRNTINIPGLAANTEVLIRLYLSDGVYETGDLNETMSSDTIPDTARASVSSEVTYSGGWTAPFVMRIKVSGTTRPHR